MSLALAPRALAPSPTRRGWVSLVLALVLAAVALAGTLGAAAVEDTDAEVEDSDQLAQLLGAMSSYRAEFEQVVLGQLGDVVQTATGTMHIERPGRLRWDVDEPYPQLVVADGDRVWIYDPDLEQVTVQPFASTVAGTPAMFLTDTARLDESFRVAADPTAGQADRRFVLAPRNPDPSSLFRTVTLTFSPDGLLTGLEVVDQLDQVTRMVFRHGRLNPVLDSELFEFEVPEGVDVIGNLPNDERVDSAP